VDAYQVVAPSETRTPNLHRAKIAQYECGWKEPEKKKKSRKEQKLLTRIGLLIEGPIEKWASSGTIYLGGCFSSRIWIRYIVRCT
jgi:hypothetical protein